MALDSFSAALAVYYTLLLFHLPAMAFYREPEHHHHHRKAGAEKENSQGLQIGNPTTGSKVARGWASTRNHCILQVLISIVPSKHVTVEIVPVLPSFPLYSYTI